MKPNFNIVCVKYGTKYSSERVERLYRMVEKNISLPFSFYCLTEDDTLDWKYKPIPLNLDLDLESYWWKIQLFNLPWNSPTLYFDLDIVIQNNIDSILQRIVPNKILTIKPDDAGIERQDDIIWSIDSMINSSVIGIYPATVTPVYERFIKAKDYNIVKYRGLDRYITDNHMNICHYLKFDNDYYFRWKNDNTPDRYNSANGLAHDPRKTLCLICQEQSYMYEGLEKYFL